MVYTFLCEKSGYSLKMVTLGDKSRAKLIRHYYNVFSIEAPLALCDFFILFEETSVVYLPNSKTDFKLLCAPATLDDLSRIKIKMM